MSSRSFSSAKPRAFQIKVDTMGSSNLQPAFDPRLRFNRIIRKNPDPNNHIYSIDPERLLRATRDDRLESISKLTLGAKIDHGLSLWEVFFNSENYTACVMTATSDYKSIPPQRVVTGTPFLDYEMAISRVYLNTMKEGDIVSIGLYDKFTAISYVLLYAIESMCVTTQEDRFKKDSTYTVYGLNCRMTHAVRISANGQGEELPMGEEELSKDADPFIEWVVQSVNDITEAFPWKPHLLPFIPRSYDRVGIEKRLEDIKDTEVTRYENFEDACRKAYAVVRKQAQEQRDRDRTNNERSPRKETPLAWVFGVGEFIYGIVTIDEVTEVVKFHRGSMGNATIPEIFLTGQDLKDQNPLDNSSVLILNGDDEKSEVGYNYYRILSINY